MFEYVFVNMFMKNKNIDTVTDEDIAYARSVDLNKALTVDEMPLIKALQSTVNRALKVLQQNNIIARVGAKKNGYWKILV